MAEGLMVRIVLHRLDGVAEITWADEEAGNAHEIHRTWESMGPDGVVARYENYRRMSWMLGKPVSHFRQVMGSAEPVKESDDPEQSA